MKYQEKYNKIGRYKMKNKLTRSEICKIYLPWLKKSSILVEIIETFRISAEPESNKARVARERISVRAIAPSSTVFFTNRKSLNQTDNNNLWHPKVKTIFNIQNKNSIEISFFSHSFYCLHSYLYRWICNKTSLLTGSLSSNHYWKVESLLHENSHDQKNINFLIKHQL